MFFLPSFTQAKIVFRSKRDGSRNLYVMDDNGSNVKKITADEPGWPVPGWPVWSPDGRQIAFDRRPPGAPFWPQWYNIYIINNDGSNLQRLTHEQALEGRPSWSPDGQHIIFDSNRNGTSQIWKMNLITKELQQLTRTEGLSTSAAWSPNGKYIVFRDDAPTGYFTVYMMRANGSERRALVPGDSLHLRYSPRWSPDSKSVVYIEHTLDQTLRVISVNPVIQNIETDKRKIVDTPNNWDIHSACFADNGRQLLIAAILLNEEAPNSEKYDIYSYHLLSGEIVNLTNTSSDDFMMDWISDDVLSVTANGKKKVTWSELKKK